MRMRCGMKWTQLPLTFCFGQKTDQKEASLLNDKHADLWTHIFERIVSGVARDDLESYSKNKLEECNGKV